MPPRDPLEDITGMNNPEAGFINPSRLFTEAYSSLGKIPSMLDNAINGLISVINDLYYKLDNINEVVENLQRHQRFPLTAGEQQRLSTHYTAIHGLGESITRQAIGSAVTSMTLGEFAIMPPMFKERLAKSVLSVLESENVATDIKKAVLTQFAPYLSAVPGFIEEALSSPETASYLSGIILPDVNEVIEQISNLRQQGYKPTGLSTLGNVIRTATAIKDANEFINKIKTGSLTLKESRLYENIAPLSRFPQILTPEGLESLKSFGQGIEDPRARSTFYRFFQTPLSELTAEEQKIGTTYYSQFRQAHPEYNLPEFEGLKSQEQILTSLRGTQNLFEKQAELSARDSKNIEKLTSLFQERLREMEKRFEQAKTREERTYYEAYRKSLQAALEPGTIAALYMTFGQGNYREAYKWIEEFIHTKNVAEVKSMEAERLRGNPLILESAFPYEVDVATEKVLKSIPLGDRLRQNWYGRYRNNPLRRIIEEPFEFISDFAISKLTDVGGTLFNFMSLNPADILNEGLRKYASMGAPLTLQMGGRLGYFATGMAPQNIAFERNMMTEFMSAAGLPYDQIQRMFMQYTGIAGTGTSRSGSQIGGELMLYSLLGRVGGYTGQEDYLTRIIAQTQRMLENKDIWFGMANTFFDVILDRDLKTVIGSDEILHALQTIPQMASRYGGLTQEGFAGYVTAMQLLTQQGIPSVRGAMGVQALGGMTEAFVSKPGQPFSPLLALALGPYLRGMSFEDLVKTQISISRGQMFAPIGPEGTPLISALTQGVLGLTKGNEYEAAFLLNIMGLGDIAQLHSMIQVFSKPENAEKLNYANLQKYLGERRTITAGGVEWEIGEEEEKGRYYLSSKEEGRQRKISFSSLGELLSTAEGREIFTEFARSTGLELSEEDITAFASMTQTDAFQTLQNIVMREENIISNLEGITTILTEISKSLSDIVSNAAGALGGSPAGRGISSILALITGFLGGSGLRFGSDLIRNVVVWIGDKIKDIFNRRGKGGPPGGEGAPGGIDEIIDDLGENINEVISNIVGTVTTGITTTINNIRDTITKTIPNTIEGIISGAGETIDNLKENIGGVISNVVGTVTGGITTTINSIRDGINNTIPNLIEGIISGADTTIDSLRESMGGVISSIVAGIKTYFENVKKRMSEPTPKLETPLRSEEEQRQDMLKILFGVVAQTFPFLSPFLNFILPKISLPSPESVAAGGAAGIGVAGVVGAENRLSPEVKGLDISYYEVPQMIDEIMRSGGRKRLSNIDKVMLVSQELTKLSEQKTLESEKQDAIVQELIRNTKVGIPVLPPTIEETEVPIETITNTIPYKAETTEVNASILPSNFLPVIPPLIKEPKSPVEIDKVDKSKLSSDIKGLNFSYYEIPRMIDEIMRSGGRKGLSNIDTIMMISQTLTKISGAMENQSFGNNNTFNFHIYGNVTEDHINEMVEIMNKQNVKGVNTTTR